MPTGITGLDAYLGGGLPPESCVLVLGPPFSGKEALARQFLASGLGEAEAFVAVLTDAAVFDLRRRLAGLNGGYARLEEAGLAHFIDMFSKSGGEWIKEPHTQYLEAPLSSEKTVAAVASVLERAAGVLPVSRLVFDSLSTFAAFTGSSVSLLTLMRMAGRLRRDGVTSLILADPAAHSEMEVQNYKRHVDGVIELRHQAGENQIRLVGLGLARPSPWVNYEMDGPRIKISGSWNVMRIVG